MRKIGTISAAAGFIFLGVWMIISKGNPQLGDEIFKWWPLIIIILGVEVLTSFKGDRENEKKTGMNGLIIPVIIIFLCVNGFQGVSYYFSGNGLSFDKLIRWGEGMNVTNYKEIQCAKILEPYGTKFAFNADNSLIKLMKSTDGKIKIDAKVYTNKNESRSSYEIKESKDAYGYTISMKEDYIKRVHADIYIPDGYTISIETDNSSIKTYDSFSKSNFDIKTNSSNIELSGGESLILNIDSGTMKVNNIKDVRIKGNSGTISISGDTQIIDTRLDSGTFNLNNTLCKNINVELNSGMINIKTKDKNVDVNAGLDSGICIIDGDKRINSGLNKTMGTGNGKVRIKLDSGTIKYSSQE